MSVLVDAVTAVEKPVASSDFSLAPFSEAARREAAHHSCEDSWDDGCDSDEKLNVTSPATSGIDVETPGSEIHRKRRVLANDFANGHISGTSQALRASRAALSSSSVEGDAGGPAHLLSGSNAESTSILVELDEGDAAKMHLYGITRMIGVQFQYREYRYSRLIDAIAQARRDHPPS